MKRILTSTLSILLVLLFVGATSGTAGAQGVDKKLNKKIKKAVKKGVEFLKNKQNSDGSWTDVYKSTKYDNLNHPAGETALTLFALIESGVSRDDPVIKKGLSWLIDQDFQKTYTVSVSIMAVESIFTPEEERKAAAKWANGMKDDFETVKRELSPQAKKWMVRAATWLLEQMKKNGAWTYNRSGNADVNRVNVTGEKGFIMLKRTDEGNMSGFRWDHSNTQYALLGLHSASRCGVLIHNNNWKWMLSHWLKTQADTGPKVDLKRDGMSKNGNETGVGDGQARARHWVYQPDDKKHTNKFEMTAGGVGSVAIALHHLENQGGANEAVRTKATKSIRDGLAWLQKNWNKYPNSSLAGRGGFGDYYTLYGLERTMMLTATNTLNDHDWYVEGAKAILKEQNSDGSWRGRGEHTGKKSALAETCFALLFLKRATLPVTTGH